MLQKRIDLSGSIYEKEAIRYSYCLYCPVCTLII